MNRVPQSGTPAATPGGRSAAHRPGRAGAAGTALAAALLLSACGSAEAPAGPAAATSTATTTGTPTGSGTSTSPAGTITVPAYYAGRTGMEGGLEVALYREFHDVPSAGDPVSTALREMLQPPRDPDYFVPWPEGTEVLGVERMQDLVTVELSAEAATAPPGAGEDQAQAALQQVVHTVTAADPSVAGVQLMIDGSRVPDLWGLGAHAGEALARAEASSVLGPVWVLGPAQGAEVTSPVTLGGEASVFEATVGWEVLDASGAVVADGFTTAAEGAPGRGAWSVEVPLGPGEHTVRAFSVSARDGSVVAVDSKDVTVAG
ncbi:GerMN domain-containing protein [Paenibacillus sp. TRM 82003]|uniref:Gmad2 immunoglobulin-like domain-containing protein n=1 Tax=Kineococcus sp. TRM81007 TaxID=2925831 RepID=UPI001F58ABD9|nr:Gmad2 immunoglobulin-like domain-containing protein [Kineococcus sp. TRM81007]MCI2239849.1 GerMN domain-containing protein [Kineococcus sp. TRM81007]MCI3925847.1 GerMN domain-containing protein [Paenibacillus sp. TRM 82003]